MKNISIFIVVLFLIFGVFAVFNKNDKSVSEVPIVEPQQIIQPVISIYPEVIFPGDPLFITVNSTFEPKEISFDNKKLSVFDYDGKIRALTSIDFNEKNISHIIKVILSDNSIITKTINLTLREKIEKPLGIPEKLGGNTPQAEKTLLSNLTKENLVLNNIKSATTTLWKKPFVKPLENLVVTDDYGYDRKTVNSIIIHKGTDFRTLVGTKVMAMNDGVVKVARNFIIFGNTVVIDHGLGLQTLYMHLSKINVKEGDKIVEGQVVGLSGQTGYAEAPHLHVSIKINSISIDPMVFMNFFK